MEAYHNPQLLIAEENSPAIVTPNTFEDWLVATAQALRKKVDHVSWACTYQETGSH
jgi:hypothetical protein